MDFEGFEGIIYIYIYIYIYDFKKGFVRDYFMILRVLHMILKGILINFSGDWMGFVKVYTWVLIDFNCFVRDFEGIIYDFKVMLEGF